MNGLHPDAYSLESIDRYSTALAEAARDGALAVSIPSCSGWTMADLVRHVAEVQYFWAFVIDTRPDGPEGYEEPPRPGDDGLVPFLETATTKLLNALAAADPEQPAWSWSAEQTVGFTIRRQTHEALTHSIDAVLARGLELSEVPAELAADGVDEVVKIMLHPDRTTDSIAPVVAKLSATDTADEWTAAVRADASSPVDVTIEGAALDLNLWLWGRADTTALTLHGDAAAASTLRQHITAATL